MKSIRILIEEIDHEDRAEPIHLAMVTVPHADRRNPQVCALLLKALQKFSEHQEPVRARD